MIKDVMVHLDGTGEDETRLSYAGLIVGATGAHLTGLYTNLLPDYATVMPIEAGAAAVSVVADLEEQVRVQGDQVQRRLAERLDALAIPNELRRIEARPATISRLAARQARWSDLFIATCPYRDDASADWGDLAEAVLLESGHGVLLLPPGAKPKDAIRRVLVAWRDCREAARAVSQAMSLIEQSTRTDIVYVAAKDDEATAQSAADLAAHLDRHGANVDIHPIASGSEAAEVLLDEAARLSSDLIVMGGYGHSRLREWILGGTTRDVIAATDVPLLLAH